ncbi:MAG: diaminopimelate decarboxylase [Candidatus Marinimicrobia bacterium]|nr:diaminopimelate decarboxylase [Candidatus Neomarinimicrobiota bacterium]
MKNLKIISDKKIIEITKSFNLPIYVYDENTLLESAKQVINFPNAYGFTPRYAIKALSTAAILKLFNEYGLHFDASSGYEVERAIRIGITPDKIQLTSQELPNNIEEFVKKGIIFNATSLFQLESYGKLFPDTNISIRINPGMGSGHVKRVNVGGPSSSFGIWKDDIPQAKIIAKKYNLKINKLHTHIGSGTDPDIWKKVAKLSLNTVKLFPNVHTLNLGGGFKVAHSDHEKTTDIQNTGNIIKDIFMDFYKETGRKIKLEIEPGNYLVTKSGILITKIIDKNYTGKDGYNFIKINSGITEITRPAMYGSFHSMYIIKNNENNINEEEETIVVGHCCESSDILTPEINDPEELQPVKLKRAEIGDYLIVENIGAYCSSMSFSNYNSFPQAGELLLKSDENLKVIRKKQTMEQIIQNEVTS